MPIISKLSLKVYVREEDYADETNLLEDQADVSDKNVKVSVGVGNKKSNRKVEVEVESPNGFNQFNLDDQTENRIVLNDERDIEFESFEGVEEVILKGCEKGCTYGSLRGGKVNGAENGEEVGKEGNKDVKKSMQLSDSGEDGKSKQAKDQSDKKKGVNAVDNSFNFGKGSDETNESMGCGMRNLKEETSGTNKRKLFLLHKDKSVEKEGVAIEAMDLFHKNKDYFKELT